MSCIALHARRLLGWRLASIKPSENEAKALDSNDTPQVMQSYLVWRRSSMFLSLPMMIYAAISGFANFYTVLHQTEGYYDYINWFGVFLDSLPHAADAVLFLGVIGALYYWKEWHKTSRVLKYGWLAATVMPLIPALVPIDFILSDPNNEIEEVDIQANRLWYAIAYGFDLLPLIISFPASCVRAALRIRGLIPDSYLSGWIISIAAPFQSLLYLVSLIFIIQLMGNWILVAGAFLLCLAPWLYVFRRNLYVSVSNDEKEKKIDVNQKIMMCMNIVAVMLLVVWAHTFKIEHISIVGMKIVGMEAEDDDIPVPVVPVLGMDAENDEDDPFVTYPYLFNFLSEYFVRLLLSTLVFGDTILCMTVENFWHNHSRLQDQDTSHRIQETFAKLEYITSRKLASAEDDAESQDSTP